MSHLTSQRNNVLSQPDEINVYGYNSLNFNENILFVCPVWYESPFSNILISLLCYMSYYKILNDFPADRIVYNY